MQHHQFENIITETLDAAHKMLTRKSEGYSNDEDRLHNFRTGSALNGVSMEQVCWGMATKHIISIRDMVMSGESYPAEVWDEKLGDAINYLAILKAITVETSGSESDETLAKLREKLVGGPHPSYEAAQIHVDKEGGVTPAYTNAYSMGVEARPQTQKQRDLDAIKRVADRNK